MPRMRIYDRTYFGTDEQGYLREYEWDEDVVDLGVGAGRIPCPGCECDGPTPGEERNNDSLECVECKDTGFVLVSI